MTEYSKRANQARTAADTTACQRALPLAAEVEEIEKELQAATPGEQDSIKDKLRKKRAE